VFCFLSKISHQKYSSSILVVKNNNEALKYTDELTHIRRSGLDGVISFKWTYLGESVGLVPKE